MDIAGVKRMAIVFYDLPPDAEPTRSQIGVIEKMARDGKFDSAMKKGRKWFFDLEKEFGNGS